MLPSLPAAAPLVRFQRLLAEAPPPARADRSALGTLPTRAYRYCDAVTAASGWGWWIYPPIEFSLLWDGERIHWHCAALDDWLPLDDAAQFPGFADRFDAAAPAVARGFSAPFLTALPEPGVVQAWTGLSARTLPGWSLLLRAPANLPRQPGIELFEGIVETDRWQGPLFTNIRLTRTDTPVAFRPHVPLLQAMPVPQAAYADAAGAAFDLADGLDAMTEGDWAGYIDAVVQPNLDPDPQPGRYAVAARKRRKSACPYAALFAGAEPVRATA
jgi:hypothetical protein